MGSQRQISLDRKTVAGLKLDAGKTDQIFFDADIRGFGLRLRNEYGRLRGSWIVQYRVKGRTRRLKIGDAAKLNADQARQAARKALAAVTLGRDPQAEKEAERVNSSRTLRSVATEYLEMKQPKLRPASFRVTRLYLTGDYFKPLHAFAISDITRADIAPRLNAITRDSGSVTCSRARSALSTLYTWAMKQGYAENNPVIGTEDPGPATARERVLSESELAAIWRACDDTDFGKIVRLLILTGCRREEIGGLRWSEINDDATISLPAERVKNRHAHTLPITPLAQEIIDSIKQKRIDRDHLFGGRSVSGFTDWNRQKSELDARLKMADWRLHDLRRSLATWMAEHDVEPHTIEAVLNHQSGHKAGVAGIYNRAKYARQIHAALATWDDHLRSLIEGGERRIVPLRA
jgi:integrase